MYLVQILLPLHDNQGERFGYEMYSRLGEELTNRFGGLTAYVRSPAEGTWKPDERTHQDEIVIYEVMAVRIDRPWWAALRSRLEAEFSQEVVIVRASSIELL